MTKRIARLPEPTAAILPSGNSTILGPGDYPVAELDGTAADGTPGQALYLDRLGDLVAVASHNMRYVRDDNGYTAVVEKLNTWQEHRRNLTDARDLVGTALHKIEAIDLPTAKLIGQAFANTLESEQDHAQDLINRLYEETERLYEERNR